MTMSTQPTSPGAAQGRSMRDHWLLFVIEGIVLVVLGALAGQAGSPAAADVLFDADLSA